MRPEKTQVSMCIREAWSVFADRRCLLQAPGYSKRDEQDLLTYLVDVQADLSLSGHTGLVASFVMRWLINVLFECLNTNEPGHSIFFKSTGAPSIYWYQFIICAVGHSIPFKITGAHF